MQNISLKRQEKTEWLVWHDATFCDPVRKNSFNRSYKPYFTFKQNFNCEFKIIFKLNKIVKSLENINDPKKQKLLRGHKQTKPEVVEKVKGI